MRVFSKISASMMTVLGVTVGALVASPAEAQLVAEARSVEVHVVVESSGHTVVSDTVEWQVSSGQMTAMAFPNLAKWARAVEGYRNEEPGMGVRGQPQDASGHVVLAVFVRRQPH